MNQKLALRVLDQIMGWDAATSAREFAWLSLMSRLKYDGYRGYLAGARFLESLADWLQQFGTEERETAYRFLRERLVYVGPHEIQHLIDLVYPEIVEPTLVRAVAARCGVPPHAVWSKPESARMFERLKRGCMFLGLSDGARMDAFRRMNEGRIVNDQVAAATELDDSKWASMLATLRTDVGDPAAKFEHVFLLDDFVGSGTTLLRPDKKNGGWTGKLERFWGIISSNRLLETHLVEDYDVLVHHYIATTQAKVGVEERERSAREQRPDTWFHKVLFTFGMVLEGLGLDSARYPDMAPLIDKYYDPSIETDSIREGGSDARWGFARCGLPLVLEHNTPNNSIALIWADTAGGDGVHAMRPLFRRRQRFIV